MKAPVSFHHFPGPGDGNDEFDFQVGFLASLRGRRMCKNESDES